MNEFNLSDGFHWYQVAVWNSSVEAIISYRVKARSEMRAKIAVRELYDPTQLARRTLRVWVAAEVSSPELYLTTSPAPDSWEPL